MIHMCMYPLTQLLDEPHVQDIAAAHDKTAAQVLLRWGLQHGVGVSIYSKV